LEIGIDFHGVINENPEFWAHYTKEMHDNGNVIHVVTGGERSEVEPFLKKNDIKFDKIFSIIDDAVERGIEVKRDEQGKNPIIADKIWKRAKGMYAKSAGLDIHIDDTEQYGRYFPKKCRFILWK